MTIHAKGKKLLEGPSLVILMLCAVVFIVLRCVETSGGLPRFAASYLDDLICLPMVLGSILVAHRFLVRPLTRLALSHSLAVFLVFSLYFELILPRLSNNFTGDPWDIVMYAVGFAIFQRGVNRPLTPIYSA